jgi:hypothetical protein
MKIEHIIRVLAGTMVLVSAALVFYVSHWWLLLTIFVGLNLIQSAFTGFCPPELILRRLGVGGQKSVGPEGSAVEKGRTCCG